MTLSMDNPVYPVRIVLRRTGLTAELLRAWERRYEVVHPGRTQGGQRLYSEADVERLLLLKRATAYGHSIGRVAQLTNDEVTGLLEAAPQHAVTRPTETSLDYSTSIRQRGLEALGWMDGGTLDALLRQAAVRMGPVAFAEQVVVPFVREIGDLWHQGKLRIVQEHLATATIRQVMSNLLAFTVTTPSAPVFIAATTSGQHHEIGALLAAAIAAGEGWRAVYLGSDLPGEEIAIAAERLRARAVGISLVYPIEDPAIEPDLRALSQALGTRTPVFIGGEGARHYRSLIDRLQLRPIESLDGLRLELSQVSAG